MQKGFVVRCAFAALLVPAHILAQSSPPAEFFEARIRPLLATYCYACHGAKVQMAGLNLSTAAGVLKGTDSGPVLLKGDPEKSRIIQAVSYRGKIKMPPTAQLTAQQIADLTNWVAMGAPWPDARADTVPVHTNDESRGQKKFWSFLPVKDSAPPSVHNQAWIQSPIDNFILSKLEENGVVPAPPADKLTLLRRVTFDLTGLPPTEQEIQNFLADESPQAFAQVVERLLATPRYGERWGRHWLDVARYADSTGADEDHRYPYAWRYRDYVIDAFAGDLPYNQFLMEQLAGDLLPAEKAGEVNSRGIVATGFLALGPKLIAEQDKVKMVYDIVDEQIDVTSRAFMGLTMACARCHDHKFDPISTKDYYSLASIFASTKQLGKIEGTVSELYFAPLVPKDVAERYQQYQDKVNAKKRAADEIVEQEAALYAARLLPSMGNYMIAARDMYAGGALVQELARKQGLEQVILEKWAEYLKPNKDVRPHLERWYNAAPSATNQIAREYQDRFEATLKGWEDTLSQWRLKYAAAMEAQMPLPQKPEFMAGMDRFFAEVYFGKGPFALPEKDGERERYFSQESRDRTAALRRAVDDLKKTAPPEPPMACAVSEGHPVQQRVFIRGNPANPGDEVSKRFPVVLAGENQPPIQQGSGRLELARWLTEPSNPLTARVMVNRLWQWHFGEGIVRTPSNYGLMGEPPTHPELLDYLASRFTESGWSIKAMHRLILLSSTYQMSAENTREKIAADPSNRLWSRFNRRRLDVEEIRDGLLALDGSLDLTKGGTLQEGQGTDVEFSEKRLSYNPDNSKRRTVYLPIRRSNLPTLLNLFDFGDATTSGEGRAQTNVAPQALFMMNSNFVTDRARSLAKLLLADSSSDDARRVERAYLLTLARKPSATEPNEIKEALEYISGFQQKTSSPEARLDGWQSFCRILIASNDFVYVN